jgi:hypothetical protein
VDQSAVKIWLKTGSLSKVTIMFVQSDNVSLREHQQLLKEIAGKTPILGD